MRIRTNPAVRLIPPSSLTGEKWLAENLLLRNRFALPAPGVLLLVACMQPEPIEDVVADIALRLSLPVQAIDRVAQMLMDKELLISALSPEMHWFIELSKRWSAHGWTDAADYHLSTFDYQFEGADEEGLQHARDRMVGYGEEEPDLNRTKSYAQAINRITLPKPSEELVPAPCSTVWRREIPGQELDYLALTKILTLTCGITGTISTPQREWGGALAFHRSSPSGGARHPTEVYVVIIACSGIPAGWYHVSTDPLELELLQADGTDPDKLAHLFPSAYSRAPFPVAAILVLTSIFERNMYRYREPRTFRTVHMDAGHIGATAELLAAGLGGKAFLQYDANGAAIERELGLHGLEEGFQLTVALG